MTIKGKILESGKEIYRRWFEKWGIIDSPIGVAIFSCLAKIKIALRRNSPPVTVHIEPINICNAKCKMCPYVLSKRKKQAMSMDLFKRIIDECAEYGVETVVVTGLGEPLLDPTIYEKLSYAVGAGLTVRMVTNASLLDKKAAQKLLETGIHELEFSVDGYDKKTYEKIRKGLSYERVISNIFNFLDERARKGIYNPKTLVNFVCFADNRKDAERFKRYWENKVDFVRIAMARSWQGAINLRGGRKHFATMCLKIPCELLWLEMAISSDGIAVACCTDWKRTLIIGDLTKQSVKDIWSGEEAMRLRRIHLKGKRGDIPTCRNCEHFFRL